MMSPTLMLLHRSAQGAAQGAQGAQGFAQGLAQVCAGAQDLAQGNPAQVFGPCAGLPVQG